MQASTWHEHCGPNACADGADRADRPFFRICNVYVGGRNGTRLKGSLQYGYMYSCTTEENCLHFRPRFDSIAGDSVPLCPCPLSRRTRGRCGGVQFPLRERGEARTLIKVRRGVRSVRLTRIYARHALVLQGRAILVEVQATSRCRCTLRWRGPRPVCDGEQWSLEEATRRIGTLTLAAIPRPSGDWRALPPSRLTVPVLLK